MLQDYISATACCYIDNQELYACYSSSLPSDTLMQLYILLDKQCEAYIHVCMVIICLVAV